MTVVNVSITGIQTPVSFEALEATGSGYEGCSRRYTLEQSSLLDTDWQAVTGWTDITGTRQTVSHQPSEGAPSPNFYRIRVWLVP